ncbi:MAG: hypothetical protein WCF67_23340, partial [Chitinophagaceae bacterium]
MRIVFIAAPPGKLNEDPSAGLPEQAIRELSELHPEHEWIILKGVPLPGRFAFFKKRQNIRELRALQPDLLLYASPENLQPLDKQPLIVMVTAPFGKPKDHWKKALPFIKTILTDTEWQKNGLTSSFGLKSGQVKLLRWMEDEHADDWHNKQLTREKYTAGSEYFYYGAPIKPDG